jgi:hypothetical protein
LTNLPLADALKVSALATQTGRAGLLMEYISRYSSDPLAIENLLSKSPDAIKAIRYVYDARIGQYRDLSTGRFVSPRDLPWPGNGGFAIDPVQKILPQGMIIDRYGNLAGRYAGEPGASVLARGMAIGSEDMPYTKLRVIKPLPVLAGPAAEVPEFGAYGGAMQYYFENGVQWWIDKGYLEVVP